MKGRVRRRLNRPPWLALRWVLKRIVGVAFRLTRRFRVEGAEHLPRRRGGMILTSNHAAWIDTVYWIVAVRPRFTVCGARPSYFATGARRALMALANIEEVVDEESFRRSTAELLAAGETLLVYPEMGRNAERMGEFRTWAAQAAIENGVPLLPAHLSGTGMKAKSGGSRRVTLRVGPPIPALGGPDDDPTELTARLRRAIEGLAPGGAA